MTEKAFRSLLLEAVDSALSSLGDSARQAVYFHLEKKFDISRDDIPGRVEDFDQGLERILGAGAQFVEVLMMKRLYGQMGSEGKILKIDQAKEFKFPDYVRAAEKAFCRRRIDRF